MKAFLLRLNIVLLAALVLASCANKDTIELGGVWESSLGQCVLPGTTDENKLGDGLGGGSGSMGMDEEGKDERVTTQLTRLNPYYGKVTYEKEIEVPEKMVGKRMTLYMERTKPSTLWVDGELIGSICQLYAPHEYELPALSAGMHSIKIEIDNSSTAVPAAVQGSHAWTDATQTNWNGILGEFCIKATPHNYIKSVKTYPDIERQGVLVKVDAVASADCEATLTFKCAKQYIAIQTQLTEGENTVEQFIGLGKHMKLWSEFHTCLYNVEVKLTTSEGADRKSTRFGVREFATDGTQFTVNGYKTFLRGTHDACVFPLTGYAPTDVEEWKRMFCIAKEYGINHYRFHSYTPTEAAFEAADQVGIYLSPELPLWGRIDETTEHNDFLRNEAFTALEAFGNHPSFMALGLGNELNGDREIMNSWLEDFRAADDRHLYYRGSNNNLGWDGPHDGEDFYVTCRLGGAPNSDFHEDWAAELNEKGFGSHARTSFSFADAEDGGILNALRPNTVRSFANVVPLCKTPIVSHETCQFQIYPDYTEIPKYTGVLYPYNHEVFRERLEPNGLSDQVTAFHESTGKWAVECYKADMEYCLRTPGFGGYQLLDIKDYPGQGTALVGILDAFMDSKGLTTPKEFSQWNSPVVPMAKMSTYCWSSDQTIDIELVISNYEENDFAKALKWKLNGPEISEQGIINDVKVAQGDVASVGRFETSLKGITKPQTLKLTLKTGKYTNQYTLWVYPEVNKENNDIVVASRLDAQAAESLRDGAAVLLTPTHSSIEGQSVGGLFTPDYWNYAMFKSISESIGKPVSPGTLGMLMDPGHALFEIFPTDGHSNWQWWSIALNSRPLILDSLDKSYFPIIQTVDNVERNHKLGILMEFKVGKGRLLICTTDLEAISSCIEGRSYANAITAYMSSPAFNPTTEITIGELEQLLYSKVVERDIQGVENISSYEHIE